MKKLVLIALGMFLLTSCFHYSESEPYTVTGKVINKYHKDQEEKYGYHYGYSVMKGKYCYHYGSYTEEERNEVTYTFLLDTITENNKYLYDLGDNLNITYVKLYKVTKKDSTFIENKIIKIQ